jgi:hypothetical protein
VVSIALFCSSEAKARAETLRGCLLSKWDIRKRSPGSLEIDTWYERPHAGELVGEIMQRIDAADLVLCLFEADDVCNTRGSQRVCSRDNVVFEFGCAVARKGMATALGVVPTQGDAPLVSLPSDLSGVQLQRYPYNADSSNTDQFAVLADRILSLLPPTRTRPGVTMPPVTRRIFETVPIYRSLDSDREDWFLTFDTLLKEQMRARSPQLPSRLLYYGPGLAQRWLDDADDSVANSAQRAAFEKFLAGTLARVPFGGEVAVVDLGVGGFDKAKRLLSHQSLQRCSSKYVAYDISFDMMAEALSRSRAEGLLANLRRKGGDIIGINDDFRRLKHYAHLVADAKTRLFCLLGNTLGNEWAEEETLECIREGMQPDDRLLVEVQLQEEVPIPLADLETALARDVEFYGGPFIVCGVEPSALQVRIETSEQCSDGGVRLATCYWISCEFQRAATARHVALRGKEYRFRGGQRINTYLVKKYDFQTLQSFLTDKGFVHALPPVAIEEEGRKFGYFCLAAATRA